MHKYVRDFETICSEVDKEYANYIPMAPDIVQTSSFYYPSYEEFMEDSKDEKSNFVYTRGANPTTKLLEDKLAALCGGECCRVFGSGMGAISATLFSLLSSGDHVLMVNTIYGESVQFVKDLSRFGVAMDRIDVETTDDIEDYLQENTKIIYFESPSSQKFELLDLEKIASIARSRGIYTVLDGTWASPLFQDPLAFHIDLVIHSLSKYVGGHSDIVAGAVIGSKELVDLISIRGHHALGSVNAPFNSWLALRGIRTLPVRMQQFDQSVQRVIQYLMEDPRVHRIYHPMTASSEQKQLAQKYLSGYGSLLAISLTDPSFEKMVEFVNELKVFSIGVSWGGFESLVLPANKGTNQQQLIERGLSSTHIRMFIGLESPEILIQDLNQALTKVYGGI